MKNIDNNNGGDMETLIKIEQCADGSLAKYFKQANGVVIVEFNGGY